MNHQTRTRSVQSVRRVRPVRHLQQALAALFLLAATHAHAEEAEVDALVLTATNMVRQILPQGSNYFMGDVGIGTETPEEALHVIGNIRATGSITCDQGTIRGAATNETSAFMGRGIETGFPAPLCPGLASEDASAHFRSTAFGRGAGASGHATVALGHSAMAQDSYSVAVGYQANATNYGVAVGGSAVADELAVALGNGADATGMWAIAIGYQSAATEGAIAIGPGSEATNANSTAIGFSAKSTRANQILLGRDVDTVDIPGNCAVAGTLRVEQGITYVPPMGDLAMGTFTQE